MSLEIGDLKELVLLPAVLCYFAAGGPRPVWARWLVVQLGLALFVEILGKLTGFWGMNNHVFYNLYMLLEFGTISMMVWSVHPRERYATWSVFTAFVLFLIVFWWDVSRGTLMAFSTRALITGGFLLASLASIALVRLMRDTSRPMYEKAEFWALLSIAFYFFCFLPIFGLYNYLDRRNSPVADPVYAINDLLFIVRYGMTIPSFLLLRWQRPVLA